MSRPASNHSLIAATRVMSAIEDGRTALSFDDLSGLETLPGQLSRLSKLTTLNIRNTQITDLSAVSGISTLRRLAIDNTQVSDLSPIATLPGLRSLSVSGTRVTNLAPLSTVTSLEVLVAYKTSISTIDAIRELIQLQRLEINDTQVSDLVPLARLSALRVFIIRNTPVADLQPLTSARKLQRIDFDNTRVSNIAALSSLLDLRVVRGRGTKITDISPLAFLTELGKLDIGRTRVKDLGPLAGLRRLNRINVDATDVVDLFPLSGLNGILRINLSNTKVHSLAPLSSSGNMERIFASNTLVSDLTPIDNLSNLKGLHVGGTLITDLSAVKNLENLRGLDVSDTKVVDLSPITALAKLEVGAREYPEEYGISFARCLVSPDLQGIAQLPNPQRTIDTLRYLRGELDTSATPPPPESVVEPQAPTSLLFEMDAESGRIAIAAKQVGLENGRNDYLQRQLHRGLLESISNFLALCAPGLPGSNRLGPWRDLAQAFQETLGTTPVELQLGLAILRGNGLRNALIADDQVRQSPDSLVEPMPEQANSALRTVVEAWNIYVATDPFLDAIDCRRLGPDAREHKEIETAKTRSAIDDAERLSIATPKAEVVSSNLAGSAIFSHISRHLPRAHFVPVALGLVAEAPRKQSNAYCGVPKRATSQLAHDSRATKSRRRDARYDGGRQRRRRANPTADSPAGRSMVPVLQRVLDEGFGPVRGGIYGRSRQRLGAGGQQQ
ncbi:MAG: hypothetical protein KIT25_16940 [Enhydrobacter sp.]|nr:MAG: hypothetical protein KIT25_16940 [Enhydrobacter sp.]